MPKTVIALFDDIGQAQDAVDALLAEGFGAESIQTQTGEEFLQRGQLPPPAHQHHDVWPAMKRFLDELGVTAPQPPAEEGAMPIERDDAIVLVEAPDDRADAAAALLDRRGAVDIEARRSEARQPRRASGFEPATSGRTPPDLREVPIHGDVDERALAHGEPAARDRPRAARVYDDSNDTPPRQH